MSIFFYIAHFAILVCGVYPDFLVEFADLFHKSVDVMELCASVL
jgi:hypothetical protein